LFWARTAVRSEVMSRVNVEQIHTILSIKNTDSRPGVYYSHIHIFSFVILLEVERMLERLTLAMLTPRRGMTPLISRYCTLLIWRQPVPSSYLHFEAGGDDFKVYTYN
jgi:hypothetical protein